MAFNVWKLDKIVFPSSVEFSQIHNGRFGADIESLVEHPAGHPYPMFRGNKQQRPIVEFSTSDLDTLLANCGVGGASVTSTTTAYLKLATATGSVARATTSHKKIAIAQGLLYWTSISLPHNGRGEAQVVFVASYDGTNAPFVYTGSVALSGNLPAGSYWGAGPVSINGSAIPGIESIEIASGVRLIQAGESSEPWDSFVGIEMAQPTITVKTKEAVNWATLGLTGTALDGSAGITCYARKYAAQGRVANGTNGHIKFVGISGSAIPIDSAGQDAGPVTDTFRCELISSSDSVAPLVGTRNTTIS